MRDLALDRFEALFGPEFGHGKPFDLARVRAALDTVGAPDQKLPPVVHIAGTNGKGSTLAFMRAIGEAAGLKVHAFTKPHLFQLNERFNLAGQSAPVDALVRAAEHVAQADPGLTQFDAQVISAFLLFADTAADLVLLEAGMGGRLDSTNVIARPALTLITPIALDHQDALGPTLADIAAHKAGIIKRGVAAIVARQLPEALEVLAAAAERAGSPLLSQGAHWDAFESGGRLVVQTQSRALDLPIPALHGQHQIDNAGLACAAMLQLFDFEDGAFSEGVRNARWPGRLQPLTRGAMSAPVRANGGEVWVDGGHNAHAAQALANALRGMQRKRPAPTIAVVGMLARKTSDSFIGALGGVVDLVIAVPLPQAHIAPALIVAQANLLGVASVAAESLQGAMRHAAQFPAPRVLVCGSLALAAEALASEGD